MAEKQKTSITSIAAIALIGVTLVVGVFVYATLPAVVELYLKNTNVLMAERTHNIMMPVLYCAGIPILLILVGALLISVNVSRGKPFTMQNVIFLNAMSVCSFCVSAVFTVPVFLLSSFFPIVIFVVFILLAVMALMFADLFKTAIRIKTENELTI